MRGRPEGSPTVGRVPEPNTFTGAGLDRAALRRTDDDWLSARLADPATRVVAATAEGPYARRDGEAWRPFFVPADRLADAAALHEPVLLGTDEADAVFAVDVDGREPGEPLFDGATAVSLRDLGAGASPADAGLLAYAAGMLNWHRSHRFCARCGAPSASAEAGHVRICTRCGAHHHPRTDPVVIMLIEDDDRLLLGRQAAWPAGRYSALAGFVEPGEGLEEAVAREVEEEAGVAVRDVRYRSSQPWPFPSSLMLGFRARYASGEAQTRDAELEDVRWFTREELAAAARGEDGMHLPPPIAIARRLIEEWM